jgi:alcohol dehydrogenase class IV
MRQPQQRLFSSLRRVVTSTAVRATGATSARTVVPQTTTRAALRGISTTSAMRSNATSTVYHEPEGAPLALDANVFAFPPVVDTDGSEFPQTVYAGTGSIDAIVAALKLAGDAQPQPLIVTDAGLVASGVIDMASDALAASGVTVAGVFSDCTPNPTHTDIANIAAFMHAHGGHTALLALGGGGPLDAAKAATVVYEMTAGAADPAAACAAAALTLVEGVGSGTSMRDVAATTQAQWYQRSGAGGRPILAFPTTAGTGSEGGKSAVIGDAAGRKLVMGDPALMPRVVGLAPQLTLGLPLGLTIGTAVDALSHSLEAFLVPRNIMLERDGMTNEEVDYCDKFAVAGIEMVLQSLPVVTAHTAGAAAAAKDDAVVLARLNLQLAALYGAKAFRKGDLGGVHATAHAVGALYHLHHGECIGRVMAAVVAHSELSPALAAPEKAAIAQLVDVFKQNGVAAASGSKTPLADALETWLRSVGAQVGLGSLKEKADAPTLPELAAAAAQDGCQTNPVALNETDYTAIITKLATTV